jgi:hypothetical protein
MAIIQRPPGHSTAARRLFNAPALERTLPEELMNFPAVLIPDLRARSCLIGALARRKK